MLPASLIAWMIAFLLGFVGDCYFPDEFSTELTRPWWLVMLTRGAWLTALILLVVYTVRPLRSRTYTQLSEVASGFVVVFISLLPVGLLTTTLWLHGLISFAQKGLLWSLLLSVGFVSGVALYRAIHHQAWFAKFHSHRAVRWLIITVCAYALYGLLGSFCLAYIRARFSGLSRGTMGEQDAFRHSSAACLVSSRLLPYTGELSGSYLWEPFEENIVHRFLFPKPHSPLDSLMDLYNNRIGDRIGRDQWPTILGTTQCFQRCRRAIETCSVFSMPRCRSHPIGRIIRSRQLPRRLQPVLLDIQSFLPSHDSPYSDQQKEDRS